MKTDHAPLDISSYLDNEEVIAEFLTAAAEDENPDVLLSAIANVAKTGGANTRDWVASMRGMKLIYV